MRFSLDKYTVLERSIPLTRLELVLPDLPPSTNNLYINVRGRGRVKSEKYSNWLERMGLYLNRQKRGRFTHPAKILFEVEDKHPRRDISNCIKPLEDLLVKSEIILDDNSKSVRSITAKWAAIDGVRITIERAA